MSGSTSQLTASQEVLNFNLTYADKSRPCDECYGQEEKFLYEMCDTYDKNDDDDDNDNTPFDEEANIQSILENQIEDLDNNNSEMSEFERDILAKYMKQFETEKNINNVTMIIDDHQIVHYENIYRDKSPTLGRFPVRQITPPKLCDKDDFLSFPLNNEVFVVSKSQINNESECELPTSSSLSSSLTSATIHQHSASTTSIDTLFASTQVALIDRNSNQNNNRIINQSNNPNNNNRNALRRNFSIWVGVTSCVWGLLLYFDKAYF